MVFINAVLIAICQAWRAMKPRLFILLAALGLCAAPVCAQQAVLAPDLSARILALHNLEREHIGAPTLEWDEALAQDAQGWAQSLVASGRFEHSPQVTRRNQGENLFMGTSGFYPIDAMIGSFLEERSDFRPGTFPAVSRSGNWHRVGHYTQLIWPQTRRIGCAIAQGRGDDVLVCRYWPAGNVMGEAVP